MEEQIIEFNVLEVISKYTTVNKKSATNYFAVCPIHNESTPSLSINIKKNIWKCFGCGHGGNAVKFVSLVEGISYKDAYKKLLMDYGYITEKNNSNNDKLYTLMSHVSNFYQHVLLNTQKGVNILNLLLERGFSKSTIMKFNVGFSTPFGSEKNDIILDISKDNGYTKKEVIECGLLNSYDKDLFRNRIMIPISVSNNVVGFMGRTVEQSDDIKYLNSPKNLIFAKEKILFNLDRVKQEVIKNREIFLCEGAFDVMSLHEAGLPAVCSMGTSFTVKQAQLLKFLNCKVNIVFDGDKAGTKAAFKAAQLLKKLDINNQICCMPEQLDPNDLLIQKGSQYLNDYIIKNLMSSSDFFFKLINLKNKSNEYVLNVCQKFFQLLKDENSISVGLLINKFSNLIELNEMDVKNSFYEWKEKQYDFSKIEKNLLGCCVFTKEIFEEIKSLVITKFFSKEYFDLFTALNDYYSRSINSKFNYTDFIKYNPNSSLQELIPKNINADYLTTVKLFNNNGINNLIKQRNK